MCQTLTDYVWFYFTQFRKKSSVTISNRPQTRHSTDTHTHPHDDSIRLNAMFCISPKNLQFCLTGVRSSAFDRTLTGKEMTAEIVICSLATFVSADLVLLLDGSQYKLARSQSVLPYTNYYISNNFCFLAFDQSHTFLLLLNKPGSFHLITALFYNSVNVKKLSKYYLLS